MVYGLSRASGFSLTREKPTNSACGGFSSEVLQKILAPINCIPMTLPSKDLQGKTLHVFGILKSRADAV